MRTKITHALSALVLAASAANAQYTISNVRVESIGHADVRVMWDSSPLTWEQVKMQYAPTPVADCAAVASAPTGITLINPVWRGNSASESVSGLAPKTEYRFCVSLGANNVYSGTSGVVASTLDTPAIHPEPPTAPAAFDAQSVPDMTSAVHVTVDSSCSRLQAEIDAAVDRQLSQGTEIKIPAGSTCTGHWAFTHKSPDIRKIESANINLTNNTFTTTSAHNFTEGEKVIFTWWDYSNHGGELPTGMKLGDTAVTYEGIPFYLHLDATDPTHTFQISYDKPVSDGGTVVVLGTYGYGPLAVAPADAHELNWIVIRTDTPDASFVPAGVRVDPSWTPKMARLQAPKSYLGPHTGGAVLLAFNDTDYNARSMLARVRLIGLELSEPFNRAAYWGTDPAPGEELIRTLTTNRSIVFDRIYAHGGGTPERVFRGFAWDGLDVAIVNSYFTNLTYAHPYLSGLGSAATGAHTFTLAAGTYGYGAGHCSLSSTATITVSGSQAGQNEAYVYCEMESNSIAISMPTGITATVSGASSIKIFPGNAWAAIATDDTSSWPSASRDGDLYFTDVIYSASAACTSTYGVIPTIYSPDDDATPVKTGTQLQLGFRFHSTGGYVCGMKWYKPVGTTSTTHTFKVWDNAGTPVASKASGSEPASGWVTVTFDTPVALTAGAEYMGVVITDAYHQSHLFWLNRGLQVGDLTVNTSYVSSSTGSCDNNDLWPQDYNGGISAARLACIDIDARAQVVSARPAVGISSTIWGAPEGCDCMIGGLGPGPYVFDNNYVEGAGNLWHHDDGGHDRPRGDYTYTRNLFHYPEYARLTGEGSDGNRYMARQMLEWKGGTRILLRGNTFDGAYSDIASNGDIIAFSMRTYIGDDANLEFNEFRHAGGGLEFMQNTGQNQERNPPGLRRYRLANNLFWDITDAARNYAPDQASGPGWIIQGPQSFTDGIIDHNSFVGNRGRVPVVLQFYGTYSEGISVTNNVMYIDGAQKGIGIDSGNIWNCGQSLKGEAVLSCLVLNYKWESNLMIPNGTTAAAIAAAYPTSATKNYILDQTLSQIGWFDYNATTGGGNFRFKPSSDYVGAKKGNDGLDLGADSCKLREYQGELVAGDANSYDATTAKISWRSADGLACSVDYATSQAALIGGPFTRTSGMAVKAQSVNLSGLTTETVYYYRINCASNQFMGSFMTQ